MSQSGMRDTRRHLCTAPLGFQCNSHWKPAKGVCVPVLGNDGGEKVRHPFSEVDVMDKKKRQDGWSVLTSRPLRTRNDLNIFT